MRGLAMLRELVQPAPPVEPADRLLAIAKTFRAPALDVAKRRTPGTERVALDDLQADPSYQRPPDREKIDAFADSYRAGRPVPAIKVNRRPDGSMWITDGQHRAAAAAICGHDLIDAEVTHKPSWEEQQDCEIIAKAAGGRIPAGDPRRGRIHPGEWTKENNPATLKKAAEDAESLPERAVIHHRLSQLRGTHAVAGLLSDTVEGHTRALLERARREATAAGAKKAVREDAGWMAQARGEAQVAALGHGWRNQLVQAALDKHPEAKAAVRKRQRADAKYHAARDAIWDTAEGKPRERARARALKARAAHLAADAELYAVRERLTGARHYTYHDSDVAQRELGVDFDKHIARNRGKIEAELRRRIAEKIASHQEQSRGFISDHQATLATHAQAKKLATAKARESRRLQPVFERQLLSGRFIGDLKKNPGHLRAMFLQGGILKDGVAYSEWTRPLKAAKVRVINTDQSVGAKVHGKPGITDTIYYAICAASAKPIELRGQKVTRADVERHLAQHAPEVKGRARTAAIAAFLDSTIGRPARDVQAWRRARNPEFRTTAEIPVEHEDQLVNAMLGAGAKVTDNEVFIPGYRSWADREMDAGKRFTIDLGHGRRVHYVPHHTVGTKTVNKYQHTFTFGGYSAQKKTALLKRLDQAIANQPNSYYQARVRELRDTIANAPKKAKTFTVETESFAVPGGSALHDEAKNQGLPPKIRAALLSWGDQSPIGQAIETAIPHTREKGQGRKAEPHRAPFSERGVLHLDNMPPADAVRVLKRLGAAKGLAEEVPYNLIYRSGRRNGRVLPQHEDYATGEHAIKVPDGVGIFHGLTGGADTIAQVKRLIRDGGLKAIAERRRLGRRTGGMSVKGDMGSGIDQYVFTNMAHSPAYGHGGIIFSLKPSVLKRRDIAFAPRDFGGSSSRYDRYNAHAKRLGQPAFHEPPGHEGRQRHLDRHLGHRLAEVLLKHEIPWEDVDSLYVAEGHHKEVDRLIRAAKRQGRVPQALRVVKGQAHSEIAARLRELSPDDD